MFAIRLLPPSACVCHSGVLEGPKRGPLSPLLWQTQAAHAAPRDGERQPRQGDRAAASWVTQPTGNSLFSVFTIDGAEILKEGGAIILVTGIVLIATAALHTTIIPGAHDVVQQQQRL